MRNLCPGLLALLIVVPGTGSASPLDREPGQRQNPAADNMLRVPGVVGLYEDEAMIALQQAGLAARVKRIRNDDSRYRDREGRVVKQVPGAGGVAMVGATVVITVYKQAPRAEDEESKHWDEAEDAGAWTSSEPVEDEVPQEEGESGSSEEVDTGGWIPPDPDEIDPDNEEMPCAGDQVSQDCEN